LFTKNQQQEKKSERDGIDPIQEKVKKWCLSCLVCKGSNVFWFFLLLLMFLFLLLHCSIVHVQLDSEAW